MTVLGSFPKMWRSWGDGKKIVAILDLSQFFLHDQSEFQRDPFQDRPAEKGGQEWVDCKRGPPWPWRRQGPQRPHGSRVLWSLTPLRAVTGSQVTRYALQGLKKA